MLIKITLVFDKNNTLLHIYQNGHYTGDLAFAHKSLSAFPKGWFRIFLKARCQDQTLSRSVLDRLR